MSEEKTIVEEQTVVEASTQEVNNEEVGGLIAESKKYRTRAQTAEAELNELKENLKLQEQKQLEEVLNDRFPDWKDSKEIEEYEEG